MTTREQLTHERLHSLLEILADDGMEPPGSASADHIEALRQATTVERTDEVAAKHRQGEQL